MFPALFVSLIFLSHHPQAHATQAGLCSTLLSNEWKPLVLNHDSRNQGLPNFALDQIQKTLHEIRFGIAKDLRVPPNLRVEVTVTGFENAAHYDHDNKLIVPYSHHAPSETTEIDKLRFTTRPFVVHELGHAIFSESLGARIPAWQAFRELRRQEEARKHLWQLAVEQLATNTLKKNEAELKKLERERLQRYHAIIADRAETLMDHMTLPYQELFADLVAVLDSNDSAIIAKTELLLKVPGAALGRRDFANPEWIKQASASEKADPHHGFPIVKSEIWAFYQANPRLHSAGNRLVNAVFEAIANELADKIPGNKLWNMTYEQMDESLLPLVKKELSALHAS